MIRRVSVVLAVLCILTPAAAQKKADPAAAVYQKRAAALQKQDVKGHYELAAWCKRKHLWTQMRAEVVLVLAIDPDHAPAHALMGRMKVGDRWLPKAKAMKAKGYVWLESKWRTPEEAALMRAKAAATKHLAKVRLEVRRLGRRLADPSKRVATKARDGLIKIGREEKIRGLGYKAEKIFHRYREYWAVVDHRRALLQIRAQKVTFLGFDNFTTSLGTGRPVTLQLPRTRSISIGTTVSVPAGVGRGR